MRLWIQGVVPLVSAMKIPVPNSPLAASMIPGQAQAVPRATIKPLQLPAHAASCHCLEAPEQAPQSFWPPEGLTRTEKPTASSVL